MLAFRAKPTNLAILAVLALALLPLSGTRLLADDKTNACEGAGCLPGMSPKDCPGANSVSPADAKALFQANLPALKAGGASAAMANLFIDTRSAELYAKGHIPGAVNLPTVDNSFTKEALLAAAGGNSKPIVIYCNGEYCPNSFKACQLAQSWGYKGQIHYFWTGMGANGWGTVNGPVVTGSKPIP